MPDFETIVKAIQSLLAGSELREVAAKHLELLRAQMLDAQYRQSQAEARARELETQCLALKQALYESQLKLQRFSNDNPLGHRCDHCGGLDLRLTGCRICQKTSLHPMKPPF